MAATRTQSRALFPAIGYIVYLGFSPFEEAIMSLSWAGVFPAATTQFAPDLSVDIPATQGVQRALIEDGVHGLIVMGTVGEGNSLGGGEKRAVLAAAVEAAAGRVLVISGVSE